MKPPQTPKLLRYKTPSLYDALSMFVFLRFILLGVTALSTTCNRDARKAAEYEGQGVPIWQGYKPWNLSWVIAACFVAGTSCTR